MDRTLAVQSRETEAVASVQPPLSALRFTASVHLRPKFPLCLEKPSIELADRTPAA